MSVVTTSPRAPVHRRVAALWALAGVLVVTLVTRLPAVRADRDLGFDDGVFGVSAVAMRQGFLPFRDVFSSQGPLFLPLVWVADLLGLRTANAPRLLALAAALVLAGAVWSVVARVTTRVHATVAALLVALGGSVIRVTGPLLADGVAMALAVSALAVAMAFADHPSTRKAVVAGALGAAAVSVKLLVVPVGLPMLVCFLPQARRRYLWWAAGAALVVAAACWLPFGLNRVVDQSVTYHQEAEVRGDVDTKRETMDKVLDEEDPAVLRAVRVVRVIVILQVVVALLHAFWRWRQGESLFGERTLSRWFALRVAAFAWLGVTLLFLLYEPTLWRHHVALLLPPLVIASMLVVTRRSAALLVGVLALTAVPMQLDRTEDVLHPEPYDDAEAALLDHLQALPDGRWAISDYPGIVWRAGLGMPPELVDPSIKRIEQGRISLDTLRDAAADERVCAVVAWRPKYAWLVPGLPEALEEAGFVVEAEFGEVTGPRIDTAGVEPEAGTNTPYRTLWTRPSCQ
jgi:hypothetical protein